VTSVGRVGEAKPANERAIGISIDETAHRLLNLQAASMEASA
jgi:hypothetical protein